jgi:hypothetical protein
MAKQPVDPASSSMSLIGAIIGALDDRNLRAALRLLEPVSETAEPDGREPRCERCATRGE